MFGYHIQQLLQKNFPEIIPFSTKMTIASPLLFKLGCAGMISVLGLGAAYGHAGRLNETGSAMFMKAQLYNVTNVLAFLACSLLHSSALPIKIAIGAFLVGQALFIAPLYYTAITGKKHANLTKLMPVGGSSLILGWTSLLLAA